MLSYFGTMKARVIYRSKIY